MQSHLTRLVPGAVVIDSLERFQHFEEEFSSGPGNVMQSQVLKQLQNNFYAPSTTSVFPSATLLFVTYIYIYIFKIVS